MTTLYKLNEQFQALADMDAGDDAGFAEALAETLIAQSEMIEEKIESTVMVARQLDSDAEACEAEAKRLQDRAKLLRGNAKTCKYRVLEVMSERGMSKINRPLFSITRTKGRPVCMIDDESKIPTKFVKTKEVVSTDKAALLKALTSGEEIEGCHLEEGKPSLRVT